MLLLKGKCYREKFYDYKCTYSNTITSVLFIESCKSKGNWNSSACNAILLKTITALPLLWSVLLSRIVYDVTVETQIEIRCMEEFWVQILQNISTSKCQDTVVFRTYGGRQTCVDIKRPRYYLSVSFCIIIQRIYCGVQLKKSPYKAHLFLCWQSWESR